MNEIKAIIQEFTEFATLVNKKRDLEKSNEELENVKNLVFTNTQLDAKIKEYVSKYEAAKIERDDLYKDYDLMSKQSEIYNNASETIENYNNELTELNDSINKCNAIKKYLIKLNEVNYYYESNINYINNKLDKRVTELKNTLLELNRKRDEMTTFYVSKRQIEKMRNELQEEFNKVNILNKIWSPKVGYPSLKIDSFLSNLTVKTNDDLTNMWGANNLKIKDFKINASDFNIVVMKDGVEIKDASLCSESETQTINTAISFSIVESNIDNNGYDILRLDELDMSLDQERRLGFMDMIQHRIEEMGVDSCFIISHNNKFDDIPADVILMSDYKLEEEQAKNKNIIFRA
jgi:DNA repair exonuclease SbcCD ATPase subunit